MRTVVADLIKAWGVQKFMAGVVTSLRVLGKSESLLADDLEKATEAYCKRSEK